MIFFDNQTNNCHTVAGVGVTVVYTPDGVTRKLFQVSYKPLQRNVRWLLVEFLLYIHTYRTQTICYKIIFEVFALRINLI